MTDCEIACKNSERALAAELAAYIFRLRSEGRTEAQILTLVLQRLDIICEH